LLFNIEKIINHDVARSYFKKLIKYKDELIQCQLINQSHLLGRQLPVITAPYK